MPILTLLVLTGLASTTTLDAGGVEPAAHASPNQTTERRFGRHGFAVSTPDPGWKIQDGAAGDAGFRVEIPLEAGGGLVAVSVTSNGVAPGSTSQIARDAGVQAASQRSEYRSHVLLEDTTVAGRPAPGAKLTWETTTSGTFTIHQRYLVNGERGLLVQAYAPEGDWESHATAFEHIVDTIRIIEPSAADARAAAIAELAARCGSEAEWADSWDAAAERAEATGRHVLVVMRAYSGFDLPDTTQISTFMDEDVLAMVAERLVPVRLDVSAPSPLQDREVYGLSPTVLGVALILMRANGTLIADTPHTEPEAVLHWLGTELAREPEPREPEWPADPLAAAALALDRGELAHAAALLGPLSSARAHATRARLHRLRNDLAAAAVEWSLAIALDPDLAAELACDRATQRVLSGDRAGARAALAPLVADPAAKQHPEAVFLMSMVAQLDLGVPAARPLRRMLVRTHPESRWAWLAAAYLLVEPLLEKTSGHVDPGPARSEVLAIMAEPPAAPVGPSFAESAERDALEWLVAHQRPNGSWPGPNELHRSDGNATDAISAAVDALATRALLQRGAPHRDAAKRGLAYLLENDARRRVQEPPVVYMDFTAWAAWAQLELVCDALDAGLGDPDELRAFGSRLVLDLGARVRRNGGWSYYLSGDAAGQNTVEQSISFTTAAAILGLARARSHDIDVAPELFDAALDCLEGMRGDDGLFAYMVFDPGGAETRSPAPGAAGRGPVCELALLFGGRATAADVRRSLEIFDEHADSLAAEVGKALMHAGVETQGCHYPFFDYVMAARATSRLEVGARRRLRLRVLELVLSARLEDGSFLDTPIIGPTYGTASALLAFHALRQ